MPIKEKILKELQAGPVKFKKLQAKFKASKKFFLAMEELYSQGKVYEKNGYVHVVQEKKQVKDPSLVEGTVVKLTENFGFVRVEGLEKDIFVSGKYMMGSVPGDVVLLKKIPSSRRDFEGKVVEISKEKHNLVGIVSNVGRFISVTLKECPYVIMKCENKAKVVLDDIVLIDIIGRGTSHSRLSCQINAVMGQVDSSEKAVAILLADKNIQQEFPLEVLNEAKKAVENNDILKEINNREDLRDVPIFTIDSASTKDIDDAISVEKCNDGYKLGVHIADVSYYIRGGSECDKNAFERGNSIYFGENVIPMLPKEYSNNLCSLNENVDRLAFSCLMKLDNNANIKDYKFVKTVIRSRVKGVYSEINEILNGNSTTDLQEKYREVYEEVLVAKELYDLLKNKRNQRGSMNIESDEAEIIFDENHRAIDIRKRERGTTEMIIEEFMLLANSCSANFAKKNGIPFVYRVHEAPDADKLFNLKENIARLGLSLNENNNRSLQQSMSELLDKTRDTNLQNVVHKQVLRAQSKAKYSVEPLGHFGLVLDDYAHFTSPIRRYSDLAIHRILSEFLLNQNVEKSKKRFTKFVNNRSKQTSNTELVAMQTERSADDIYKAEIMKSYIGEEYEGIVSGVMNYGVYVTLENTVEGLVHVSLLNMYSPILDEGYSLKCPVSGVCYKIGDKVRIKVIGTDVLNGNVDFAMADLVKDLTKPKHNEKGRKSNKKRFEKEKGVKAPKKVKYQRKK